MNKYIIPLTALGCITLLESIALFKGLNGTLLSLSLASIGGVLGYCLKMRQK
ncbi:hypothetical protein ES705_34490 [subsurface metagenome]